MRTSRWVILVTPVSPRPIGLGDGADIPGVATGRGDPGVGVDRTSAQSCPKAQAAARPGFWLADWA
jgi:hypothetical protein